MNQHRQPAAPAPLLLDLIQRNNDAVREYLCHGNFSRGIAVLHEAVELVRRELQEQQEQQEEAEPSSSATKTTPTNGDGVSALRTGHPIDRDLESSVGQNQQGGRILPTPPSGASSLCRTRTTSATTSTRPTPPTTTSNSKQPNSPSSSSKDYCGCFPPVVSFVPLSVIRSSCSSSSATTKVPSATASSPASSMKSQHRAPATPAAIFCGGAWVFSHALVVQSDTNHSDASCFCSSSSHTRQRRTSPSDDIADRSTCTLRDVSAIVLFNLGLALQFKILRAGVVSSVSAATSNKEQQEQQQEDGSATNHHRNHHHISLQNFLNQNYSTSRRHHQRRTAALAMYRRALSLLKVPPAPAEFQRRRQQEGQKIEEWKRVLHLALCNNCAILHSLEEDSSSSSRGRNSASAAAPIATDSAQRVQACVSAILSGLPLTVLVPPNTVASGRSASPWQERRQQDPEEDRGQLLPPPQQTQQQQQREQDGSGTPHYHHQRNSTSNGEGSNFLGLNTAPATSSAPSPAPAAILQQQEEEQGQEQNGDQPYWQQQQQHHSRFLASIICTSFSPSSSTLLAAGGTGNSTTTTGTPNVVNSSLPMAVLAGEESFVYLRPSSQGGKRINMNNRNSNNGKTTTRQPHKLFDACFALNVFFWTTRVAPVA